MPHADGYESKLDVVLTEAPRLKHSDRTLGPTTVIAPDLASIHYGWKLMQRGRVLDRPGLFVNVPTLLDSSMAPAGPTRAEHRGRCLRRSRCAVKWTDSVEPHRWLEAFADLCEPGLMESIVRLAGDDSGPLRV